MTDVGTQCIVPLVCAKDNSNSCRKENSYIRTDMLVGVFEVVP